MCPSIGHVCDVDFGLQSYRLIANANFASSSIVSETCNMTLEVFGDLPKEKGCSFSGSAEVGFAENEDVPLRGSDLSIVQEIRFLDQIPKQDTCTVGHARAYMSRADIYEQVL